jgi:site-specific DNA-methyltransferase (cytosine-N4-specific)
VRRALLEAKRQQLAAPESRGRWRATKAGESALGLVEPGAVVTVLVTPFGRAVAAWAEEAAAVVDPADPIRLLFSSPPFPLLKAKSYGGISPADWLPWMVDLVGSWLPLLAEDASLAIHLGDAHLRGMAATSGYAERFQCALQDDLKLYRIQPHYWMNPTRAPETEWAAKRRKLVRNAVEPILWYCRAPVPRSDNRRVLGEYTEATKRRLAAGGRRERTVRPSGHDMHEPGWTRDCGGSIPGNLIVASPGGGSDPYRSACRAAGLPVHPAVMPVEVPERMILLATEPGDLVADFFGGSLSTAAAAERRQRRWVSTDRSQAFLKGGALRPEFRAGPRGPCAGDLPR